MDNEYQNQMYHIYFYVKIYVKIKNKLCIWKTIRKNLLI